MFIPEGVNDNLATMMLVSASALSSGLEQKRQGNMQSAPGDRKRRKQRSKKNKTAKASRKRNR